jgi:hypothetical protein
MSLRTRACVAALVLTSGVSACNREKAEAPPAQAQAQSAQTLNAPATLTGCLRAGEAENTFVLTASQTADGTTPATYHLNPPPNMRLQDHVGYRIEVTGVISDQQTVATREAPRAADQKATGTAGTPTVQTGTTLAVRRMEVNSARRVEGKCE